MKTRILNFNLKGQILSLDENCNTEKIVQKTRHYLWAVFSFDDEWDGTGTKTAIFKGSGEKPEKRVLDENGRCEVPSSAAAAQRFTVFVIGGDLLTSSPVVIDSIKTGKLTDRMTPDEQNWYVSLTQKVDNLESMVDPEAIGREVNEYMKAHPVEMTGYAKTEYVDTQDAGTLKSAKDYADVQLGNVDALLQTI